jgi:hypothetical protein
MPWIKVPPEHHPLFREALPRDPRVETMQVFGGIAAKVNGHIFAGLFGRSTMIWLPAGERADALTLEGAAPFDPMGDGRARSDKIMLPEQMMAEPAELRHWVARAFKAAAKLPPKVKAPHKRLAVSTNPRLKKGTRATDVGNRRTVTARSAKRRGPSKGK